MTCQDVMTPNPKCCYPADSVVRAAQIMSEQDVGPVPVVADEQSRKLLGILTDRDLAIKVIGASREPYSLEVRDVMTENPVTCYVDDDYREATKAMAKHQVRRIPVLNRDGSLAGIIAQADVARETSDKETGAVVEEISESGPRRRFRGFGPSIEDGSSLLLTAAAFTLGAAIMYLADPDRGVTRRGQLKEKARNAYEGSADYARETGRKVKDRATGLFDKAEGEVDNLHLRRRSLEVLQSEWSPSARLTAAAVGGGLALYGIRGHGPLAKISAALGMGLMARGLSNEMPSWTGTRSKIV